jgi:copper(I)-binding protein
VAEVHEMNMEGNVMRMRAMPMLNLPAGKTVELKPGSYHLMLMDLKQALPKDTSVPLVLHFQDASGIKTQLEFNAPVRAAVPVMGRAAPHEAHAH